MNKEKLLISVNEEDVQNIINCYEKDLKELMKLQNNWNELNKQLENKYEKVGTLTNEVLYEENTKLINQQKKFIEYLENEININPYDISDYDYEDIINTILSKYKEIIGVSNEY